MRQEDLCDTECDKHGYPYPLELLGTTPVAPKHFCNIILFVNKAALQRAPFTNSCTAFSFTMQVNSSTWLVVSPCSARGGMLSTLQVVDPLLAATFSAKCRPGGAIGEPVLESKIIHFVTSVRQGIVTSILVDAIITIIYASSGTKGRLAYCRDQFPAELDRDAEEQINSNHYCNGAYVEQRF